jgi:hypothetical protein
MQHALVGAVGATLTGAVGCMALGIGGALAIVVAVGLGTRQHRCSRDSEAGVQAASRSSEIIRPATHAEI